MLQPVHRDRAPIERAVSDAAPENVFVAMASTLEPVVATGSILALDRDWASVPNPNFDWLNSGFKGTLTS